MKFSLVPLLALATALPSIMALPEPIAVLAADPAAVTIYNWPPDSQCEVETLNPAVVQVDGLRYRICPRTTSDCPAMGQYAKGTRITLRCFTRQNTTPVKGDRGWAKIASNGYWVALAGREYVSWSGSLPAC